LSTVLDADAPHASYNPVPQFLTKKHSHCQSRAKQAHSVAGLFRDKKALNVVSTTAVNQSVDLPTNEISRSTDSYKHDID